MDLKDINSTSFNSQRGNGWLPVVNSPGRAIGVLFGAFFIMLMLLSVVTMIIGGEKVMSPKGMRIFAIFQDLLVFILPAVAAAFTATRLPASLLTVNVKPRIGVIVMSLVVMVTALPAMEWLIEVNSNLHLPQSLSGLEEMLRSMEDNANSGVDALAGGTSAGDLIMGILIIGVLTGLAEELFFRGALQNLFMSMPRAKKHLAIWAAAFIFSFMHFQFFGFLPRLLLGAYFGYLIWWSGSVWVPVIAHAFNNSLVVILSWLSARAGEESELADAAALSIGSNWTTIAFSIFVTALGIYLLRERALRGRPVRQK